MSEPEQRLATVKQRISRAFEKHVGRQGVYLKSVRCQPIREMLRLRLALWIPKTADQRGLAMDHGCVRREYKIGQALDAWQQGYLGISLQNGLQARPLAGNKLIVGSMDLTIHPRINYVLHSKILGWTHQETGLAHEICLCAGTYIYEDFQKGFSQLKAINSATP